jgi:hypothetical protein
MVKAVTPYPGDAFQLYLARVLENAEMASPEQRARYGLVTREVLIASFHREAQAAHVAEVEEVVVGTSAMPERSGGGRFKLGFPRGGPHLKLLDAVRRCVAGSWRRSAGAGRAVDGAAGARAVGVGAGAVERPCRATPRRCWAARRWC